MKDKNNRPVLLLIEDNEGDAILAKEAVSFNKSDIDLIHVYDGDEAFEKLYEQDLIPDLILLDLNLPGINGIEILQILKKDEKTEKIPVIIFSMSKNENDISKCLELKADSFITKPIDLVEFFEVFKSIEEFMKTNKIEGYSNGK